MSAQGSHNDTWVTVATYMNGLEAHVARSKLESEGIAVSLADEAVVRMNWLWSNAVGGVKVQVGPRDCDRAREILGRNESNDAAALEEAALEGAPAKVLPFRSPEGASCPDCGSLRSRASWFSIRRKRRCLDCGKWR